MKELSIEEKAKAYDEALERAKKWYNAPNIDKMLTYGNRIIEEIFPELSESRDERIRKEIISAIKEDWPGHTDWIAWLEKQAQMPVDKVEPKFKVGQTIIYKGTENIAPQKMTISDIVKGQYWDDNCCIVPISDQDNWELVEQKPAWSEKYIADVFEKVGLAKIVREQSNDNLTIALQSAMIELSKFTPQPKQKWSEEDETKIKSIIALLKNPAVCTMDGNKGIIDASIKYLKSLKYRVQPQPKQEWSEEDEEMLKSIIALCDEKMKSTLYQSAIDHAIDAKNWLKDLIERVQSQSQLKPSDEQMKALDIAIRCGIQLGSWEEKALKLLKEQLFKLKKLREE